MGIGLPPSAIATDGECPYCEGVLYQAEGRRVCNECGFEQDPTTRGRSEKTDPWAEFWEERRAYIEDEADGRPKCVGGFARPYVYDD